MWKLFQVKIEQYTYLVYITHILYKLLFTKDILDIEKKRKWLFLLQRRQKKQIKKNKHKKLLKKITKDMKKNLEPFKLQAL